MLRSSTARRYADAIGHIEAAFGDDYIDELTPTKVEEWRAWALRRGLSASTINGWVSVLSAICRDVSRDHGIDDPTRGVRALPAGRTTGRRGRALTLPQFRMFIRATQLLGDEDVISEDIARMVLVACWTGLRCGELLALRWDDHDKVNGELRIERSVWRHSETSTKTDDPRRVVVVEPLERVLEDQRRWLFREQHGGLKSGLMFPAREVYARAAARRRGARVSWYRDGSSVAKPLRRICDVCGDLPDISMHSLRRTWENLLRLAGVDSLVRRSLAGWRDESTQAIYATTSTEERRSAGAALVDMVMGTPISSGNSSGNEAAR